jgi:hypothetical protein
MITARRWKEWDWIRMWAFCIEEAGPPIAGAGFDGRTAFALCDRLALTLINLKILSQSDFNVTPTGYF